MPTALIRARRVPALLVVAVGAMSLLAACSGGSNDTPTQTPLPNVSKAAAIEPAKVPPPAPVVPPRWPLTGIAATDMPVRPALAVKIENSSDARPQTGLDQADNIWEEVVEGGISRFVAVYHSQVPAELGPIRSVRPMDPAILAPMHGLIAFSGGQAPFVAALKVAGIQTISMDAGADGFYRKKGVGPAPHNVYGTPQTFWGQADADHGAAPAPQFVVAKQADAATAIASGAPAGTVRVQLSGSEKPTWSWDAGSGTYLRSEGSTPAVVRSGTRISATNIVTLSVQLVDSGTIDPAGNPVPATVLEGTGEGTLSTGGKSVSVTWKKGSVNEVLTLTAADGSTATLAPGVTWIELVPRGTGSVTMS
ncbi:DUF3048 domain-containing protein [Cellulomonas sp. URHD0024]|uniref:DUF3048 domain-containing protein n=1 Tax=Cellulomonas sp. URHD0024 TaxID=1302620 RepID=UPI00041310B6|nr:DUF3048 domain-containing protein [Cellulomonas sp. URHD0024]